MRRFPTCTNAIVILAALAGILSIAIAPSPSLAASATHPDHPHYLMGKSGSSHQPQSTKPTGQDSKFGTAASVSPPCIFPNVCYYGGPIVKSQTPFLIRWEGGTGKYPANYFTTLGNFFTDQKVTPTYPVVPSGNTYFNIASEYGVTASATATILLSTNTATRVDDSAFKSFIRNSTTFAGDVLYFYTGNDEDVTAFGNDFARGDFCTYHDYAFDRNGKAVFYAVVPYVGYSSFTNNNCDTPTAPNGLDSRGFPSTDSAVTLTAAMEMGTTTDPEFNAWENFNGAEIDDLCAFNFSPTNSSGADYQVSTTNKYIIPREWDDLKNGQNRSGGCVITAPFRG